MSFNWPPDGIEAALRKIGGFFMKRVILQSVLLGFVVGFFVACGGNSNNNGTNNNCLPGQVCQNGTLPPGAVVRYAGPLSNVQDSQAFYLAQAINGNVSNTNITFSDGDLQITAQGVPSGGTNFFVVFTIRPHPTNYWYNYCVTTGVPNSCYNPIVLTGNAAYSSNGTTHMLQLVYSPGIKLNIVVNPGTADNPFLGSQSNLSNVTINLVKNGQDPLTGDLLANANLYKYTY